ncbi:MAG: polysaccharide deacetylase family protein [candidate division WOR-3 bacterium]
MDENELPRVKGRVGSFTNFLLTLIFLGLSFWFTFLLFKNFYGEIRLSEKPLSTALKLAKPKIALFKSTHTKIALPEFTSWLDANLASWEAYLLNRRLGYRVITSRELEKGIEGYDLLILPSAICLSERERSAIRRFLSGGGGVLATGPLGARDEQGGWQGWEFLSSLFGVEVTGEIGPKGNVSASLTLKGNSPLSYRIPPGFRLEVTTYDHPLVVKAVEPRTTPLGYWYEFRTPSDLPFMSDKNCGLLYGEYRQGRFLWAGFELGAVVGSKTHQVVWERLLANSISWLRKEPVAWINPWPSVDKRAEAAVVFVCDAEFRYSQALNALRVLSNEGLSGTFFLVPEEAKNSPVITKTLAEYGEIGLHGVAVYRGEDYEERLARLKQGKELIEGLTGKKVWGFRPPEGGYDSSTLKALAELRYQYICTDSLQDRACPRVIGIGKRGLIALPKTGRDDYELLIKDSLQDTTEIFSALRDEFLGVYEVQGAYLLFLHSHLLCEEKRIVVLKRLVEFFKGKNVWFATCKEMADWWQGFEDVFVNAKRRGRSRIVVNISNQGSSEVKGILVYIAPARPVREISIKPELIGVGVPEYELKDDGKILVLKLKRLAAHTSHTFFIDCK